MGLLDNLLNRNPTRDWREQRGLQLVLDLDQESFCGIRLGDPAVRLEKVGPCEDAASARSGMYNYPGRGFQLNVERECFVEVEAAFGEGEGARAFAGGLVRHGRTAVFTASSTEADLVALLGEPASRKEEPADEDCPAHVTLLWNLERTDFSADFEDARLSQLWLGTKT